MNYIRGAASIFSAASNYYTSLPPINPSTLTGAIDVIVIERESDEPEHLGETELACSPFHVRFGKWQAFRPGDKKVNVLVNGESIPFNMKIGEAGEAFFVLETDEDVPDELLTSPLLEATKPGEANEPKTGRFGSKDVDSTSDVNQALSPEDDAQKAANADPTFLDLESGELPESRAQSPISSRSPSPGPSSPTSLPQTSEDDVDLEAGGSTPPTSTPTSRKSSTSPPSPTSRLESESEPAAASPSSFLSPGKAKAVTSALSHAPSAVVANIVGAKDAVKKGVLAASARRGSLLKKGPGDLEANQREITEGEDAPASPTYGHDVVVDMAGYHSKEGVQAEHSLEPDSDDFDLDNLNRTPLKTPPAPQEDTEELRNKVLGDITPPRRASLPHRSSTAPVPVPAGSAPATPGWAIPIPGSSRNGASTPEGLPLSRRRQFTPTAGPSSKSEQHTPTGTEQTNSYPFPTTSASPPSSSSFTPSQSPPSPSHLPIPPRTGDRAGSEPPADLHLTLPISSSPPGPEYMWEWGAFPQRSPAVDKFPSASNAATIGRSAGIGAGGGVGGGVGGGIGKANSALLFPSTRKFERAGSAAPQLESTSASGIVAGSQKAPEVGTGAGMGRPGLGSGPAAKALRATSASSPSSSRPTSSSGRAATTGSSSTTPSIASAPAGIAPSDTEFGAGGRLVPSDEDDSVFWVDIEGQHFVFQLSLCGPLDGESGGELGDDVGEAARFEEAKVSFSRFVDDRSVLESEMLVIKWGATYVSRRDGSPLFNALEHWRKSVDRVANMPAATASQPVLTHSRGSSWTRWWPTRKSNEPPRGREERPGATATGSKAISSSRTTPSTTPQPPSSRPSIPISQTAPVEVPSGDVTKAATQSTPTSPILSGESRPSSPERHYIKTLRLTSDQLKQLNLKKGANTITFSLSASGVVACTARIFLWDSADQIVVSDIDGTITKSDALGHVFTMIGRDWTHVGVAKLYTDIARNGYNIMYLTSRAIGQADSTRDYLKGIKQNNHQLPEGPVIMSPDRLMASLHREVIMRKPEVFKMACLRDIQRLFGSNAKGQFYAGFGNRITDALSYRSVNIPSSRIFTIDSAGEVKMELLELAGYKSSYIHMTDLVDQMFPPVHRNVTAEYTDFNFWRPPMQEFELPDLTPEPVSPALSARSDVSRLSRLRNFSLVSRGTSPTPIPDRSKAPNGTQAAPNQNQNQNQRQSSPLASPVLGPDHIEDFAADDASSDEASQHGYGRRDRRLSMPGSLDGRMLDDEGFGELDHEEHESPDEASINGDEDEEEEDPEAAFDDDLLAAGEMDDIPLP